MWQGPKSVGMEEDAPPASFQQALVWAAPGLPPPCPAPTPLLPAAFSCRVPSTPTVTADCRETAGHAGMAAEPSHLWTCATPISPARKRYR